MKNTREDQVKAINKFNEDYAKYEVAVKALETIKDDNALETLSHIVYQEINEKGYMIGHAKIEDKDLCDEWYQVIRKMTALRDYVMNLEYKAGKRLSNQ